MIRNIIVHNTKSTTVDYEVSDANRSAGQRILATGRNLAEDGRMPETVDTLSDESGDTSYYYRYRRHDDGQWHSWTGGSTNNGVLDLF